jgi:protein TonB
VALPLLGVCVVVGIAMWWLPRGSAPPATNTAAAVEPAAVAHTNDERKALDDLKSKLEGDFAQSEQQRQKLEQHQAELTREKQAGELELQKAKELTQQKEKELLAMQRAAASEAPAAPAAQRTVSAPTAHSSVAAASAPAAAPPAQEASSAPAAAPQNPEQVAVAAPPAAKAPPVRVAAAIDWSSCRHPEYPEWSAEHGEEGTVVVAVQVDPSGSVTDSNIAQSSGSSRLDEAARRAISKCRFRPGTIDGTAQASATSVRFVWKQ